MSADNQEAYYDKQFEEYLRLNHVISEVEVASPSASLEVVEVVEVASPSASLEVATRCRCDDSDPEYITCCSCEYVEWEIYSYRYKSSVYCNNCAYNVCGILIDKPQYAFNIDDDVYKFNKINKTKYNEAQYTIFVQFKKKYDLTVDEALNYIQACHCCGDQIQNFGDEFCSDKCGIYFEYECPKCIYKQCGLVCKICIYNENTEESDASLPVASLPDASLPDAQALSKYAETHNITIEEAIDYQTHCHCCGNHIANAVFDEVNHQYCNKRCFEHCEDYWYECYRQAECKVCGIWEYRTRRDSITAYDIQLSESKPVLVTIDAFKELNVYGQLYESLGDLAEYFGDLAFYDANE
jgi:hypothetical protein